MNVLVDTDFSIVGYVAKKRSCGWLDKGFNTVFSLLPSNQNQQAYESAGMRFVHVPLEAEIETRTLPGISAKFDEALDPPWSRCLVHRDLIDDTVVGLLGGYLVHGSLIEDRIVATSSFRRSPGARSARGPPAHSRRRPGSSRVRRRAAIGLGSNLGDRARHIAEAIGSLSELGDLVATSALYETAPVGGPEQGPT